MQQVYHSNAVKMFTLESKLKKVILQIFNWV
jgi:hypothetical protein